MDPSQVLDLYIKQYSPDRFHAFIERLTPEFNILANPARPIPISRVPLLLEKGYLEQFHMAGRLVWDVFHNRSYQELSASRIPKQLIPSDTQIPFIPFDSACNMGCIDFHISEGKLKIIEFMALPPGMIGIFPGLLARYEELMAEAVPGLEPVIFAEGWNRQRCEQLSVDHVLRPGTVDVVAIIDWDPWSQITYGEFLYTKTLLEQMGDGARCIVADPREVTLRGRKPWVRGRAVDRILNRVTLVDWTAHCTDIADYSRLLWESPEVFVYHPLLWYLADKRSLPFLCDTRALSRIGLSRELIRDLAEFIPLTRMLSDFVRPPSRTVDIRALLDQFGSPEEIVLKPVSSHASKGILYGPHDFPSEDRLAEALSSIKPDDYVAMKLVPPKEMLYPAGKGQSELWKYDLRAYIFDDSMLFTGGRFYLGEYTNQLPFRYFAPLFFV